MKIHGRKFQPHEVKMYLPRGDNDIIEVTARSILDDSAFFKLCPEPKPPQIIKKGGKRDVDLNDKGYLREVKDYGERKFAWMFLTSVTITGAEWETVNLNDPNTWLNWKDELLDCGFNSFEINRMIALMHEANCLDDTKLEEARARFLVKQLEKELSSSQTDVPHNIVSGEHVNGSALDHQESAATTSSS